ncbi:unnamed protein product [Rhizoctonia solani]|uniref:Mevalonate kinase n=1 Tax=Rhizoctonia solani TaxID=456999 RepID=A0A8H3EEJ7_9AGAM|nr:unnamed protein product [Rhizoctonia solani]
MPCRRSHISIDSATRPARSFPEDLMRICVGIEDPTNLIDDLDEALLKAGAVAVEGIGLSTGLEPSQAERPWLIGAPGKVILFGEHAVVHGVVSTQ